MHLLIKMGLVCGVALSTLIAQDSVPTSKAKTASEIETADFGPAFEKLVKLGLPDSHGASYVKLTLQIQPNSSEDEMMNYSRRAMGYSSGSRKLGSVGNAWLLPEGKGGVSTLISENYEQVKVTKKAKRNGLLRALIGPGKKTGTQGLQGDWIKVDVAEDVKKIIKALDKMSGENQTFDPSRWRYDKSAAVVAAEVLVTACHMYRAGFKEEGNRLAKKIIGMVPQPEMIIDNAVDGIASRKYTEFVKVFYKDQDWKAYHTGLQELTEQFPRGWKQLLAVRLLMPQVEKRVKGGQTQMTLIKGLELKKEAVAIFDGFLERKKPIILSPATCWLLSSTLPKSGGDDTLQLRRRYGSRGGQNITEAWVNELYAMGFDGFICLVAYSTDDNLIPVKLKSGNSGYYGGSSYSSSSDTIEDQALKEYKTMDRPCSRGEIARKLILATIPDPDNNLDDLTPEELRDIAYQWWMEHRYDSPSKLASHFMQAGDRNQIRIILQTLIVSGKDEEAKIVEDYILGADSASDNLDNVRAYLKARKGKAKNFFKKFSVMLKDEMSNGDDSSGSWQMRQAGGVEKYLKMLSVYVEGVSPKKLLKDMRFGRTPIEEGLAMLQAAIGDERSEAYIPELISLARKQKKLDDQLTIFNTIAQWQTRAYYQRSRAETRDDKVEDGHAEKVDAMIAKSKDDWVFFLNQKKKPATAEEGKKLRGAPSIAHYAAWLMEMVYFPEHMNTMQVLNTFMSTEEQWVFALKRAEEIIEKGSKAIYPDAKNVAESRRKKIRDALIPLKPVGVMEYRDKLSLNEKLAWTEIIAGYGENLPKGISGLSKIVVNVQWNGSSDEDKEYNKQLKALTLYKPVDHTFIDCVLDLMLNNAEKYHDFMVMVGGNGKPGQGLSISIWSGARAVSWKRSIMSEGVAQLVEGKAKWMAGVSQRQSGGDGGSLGGAIYKPDTSVKDEKPAIKKAADSIVAKIKEGGQVNFFFYAESAEALKKRAEKEDEDDDF